MEAEVCSGKKELNSAGGRKTVGLLKIFTFRNRGRKRNEEDSAPADGEEPKKQQRLLHTHSAEVIQAITLSFLSTHGSQY